MCLSRFICKRLISITLFIFVSSTIAGANVALFGGKSAERANNDFSGSGQRRLAAEQVQLPQSTPATKKATRTITNRELEPYERARVRSEAISEKRRKELGLPSLEEARREAALREAAWDEFLARKRREEEEKFRLEREAQLQAEMAALANAINYQRAQNYWPTAFLPGDIGGFGPFHPRFRGFRNQGSPCGFNPSPSCLLSHPFSLFNPGGFPGRRSIIVAPGTIVGGPRGGGGVVIPGRRH